MFEGELPSILKKSLANSVSVNGVYAPFGSFSKLLAQFVEPLLFHIEELPDTPLSRYGTAFKIKFMGRYFLICTEHQIQNAQPETIVILNERKNSIVSSESAVFAFPNETGETSLDLRLFEFTSPVLNGALSSHGWWNFSETIDERKTAFRFSVAVGLPSFNNGINYDILDMNIAPRAVFGENIGSTFGKLYGISIKNGLTYDPDGLSGGPVFAIVEDEFSISLKFVGITSNAGRSQINYWPASFVIGMLDYAVRK